MDKGNSPALPYTQITDRAMKVECCVLGSRYPGSQSAGDSATGPNNLQNRQS